jgi:hypothetical protein
MDGGTGTVTLSRPDGATCNTTDQPDSCSWIYTDGEQVTLTATPAPRSVFMGWSGACQGTDPCVLTMNSNQVTDVYGSFAGPQRLTVNVVTEPLAPAQVLIDPPQAVCTSAAGSCTHDLPAGTVVTLTPQPGSNALFVQWTGACTGTGPCQVSMSSAQTVTAVFRSSNQPPTAEAGGPYLGFRGQAIAFTASGSFDPDGDALSYSWAFSDGESAAGSSVTHVFTALGPHTATLTVDDGRGGVSVDQATVEIQNAAPTVTITSPANGAVLTAGSSVSITAATTDDSGVAQVQFLLDGQLLGIDFASPFEATWGNLAPGVHEIVALAVDNDGASNISATITVRVRATLAPTADAHVQDGNGNGKKNFGTTTTLQVQKSVSAGNNKWTYLKFDLSTVASVSNARVRLFGRLSGSANGVTTAAYGSATTTWTETGITWNNKPATSTGALATTAIPDTTARWYEWDLTAYLQAEKAAGRNVVTIVLQNPANSSVYDTFNSRQAASGRPELVIVP